MRGRRSAAVVLVGLVVLGPGSIRLPGQAPEPGVAPHLVGASFFVTRYTARASASFYVAGRVGAAMAVGGLVYNPSTRYRAVVVGSGTKVQFGSGNAVTVILAGAAATDGASIRAYALPRFAAGPVLINGIAAVYQPVTGSAVRRAYLDPLTVSVSVVPGLRAGISALVIADQQRPVVLGAGPSAQVRVPGGLLSLELIPTTGPHRLEVRAALSGAL